MGIGKRILIFIYVIASLLGVGYLALSFYAWGPIMPAIGWLSQVSWFFIAISVLLGIFAVGTIVLLLWAIFSPRLAMKLMIDKDHGSVSITRDAIASTAESAVQRNRGLSVKHLKLKLIGKKDPKIRLRIKVDPSNRTQLEQLGTKVHTEVLDSVERLTGLEVDRLRITFIEPAREKQVATNQASSQEYENATAAA